MYPKDSQDDTVEKPLDFHLVDELGKNDLYNKMILEKDIGIVIFRLFEMQMQGMFQDSLIPESTILQELKKLRPTQTDQRESLNRLLHKAQEFYLKRERGKYKLRVYAYRFCSLIESSSWKVFNPTKIERAFTNFIRDLDENIDHAVAQNDLQDLKIWFRESLGIFREKLMEQIETLDLQVDRALDQLKKDVRSGKIETKAYYEKIDGTLHLLKDHSSELRNVFDGSLHIKERLDRIAALKEAWQIVDERRQLNDCLKEARQSLQNVDSRLDRVKGRIRGLFNDLNKTTFKRKTEIFFRRLLETAFYDPNGACKSHIGFPNALATPTLLPKPEQFLVVDRDFKEKPAPQTLQKRVVNEELQEKNRQVKRAEQRHIDRVELWVQTILTDLKSQKRLPLHEYFFAILRAEGDLDSALAVINEVLIDQKELVKVEGATGERTMMVDEQFSGVSVWKTWIVEKKISPF